MKNNEDRIQGIGPHGRLCGEKEQHGVKNMNLLLLARFEPWLYHVIGIDLGQLPFWGFIIISGVIISIP